MAKKYSAGILPYRIRDGVLQVFINHPGGPFWAKKDNGAWHVTKGEYDSDEEPFAAAKREFKEEIGYPPPKGEYLELGTVTSHWGKEVVAWAVACEEDYAEINSQTLTLKWPPGSGQSVSFPEVDRAEWFDAAAARQKLNDYQVAFIDRLIAKIGPVNEGADLAAGDQASLL